MQIKTLDLREGEKLELFVNDIWYYGIWYFDSSETSVKRQFVILWLFVELQVSSQAL